jgi:two-component system heavy metal sensor histidine kinase CusS
MAFTRKLMKPLEQAGNQLERISRSEIGGARVEVENTGREIEKLQIEINRALDRIERLVEDTRQMSSKIAHELRTPLAVMKTSLQLSLEKNSSPGEMRLSLKDTMKELDKLIRMSEGFLLLSRIESAVPLEMARVDLSGLLLETIEKIMILYPGVEFALDVAPAIEMPGVSHMIEHAIINLLDNAARYTTDSSASVRLSTGEGHTVLEVTNRGRKVEMERPSMLSGPSVAAGNGIGLTVVQAVTKLHKADLLYEHRDGTNRFTIRFQI